jgi:hypothetical protein
MHCCPPGYGMVGAWIDQDVFKCAPIAGTPGTVNLDTGTQRNNMHSCPSNQVMVGVNPATNHLACQPVPSSNVVTERVDLGTQDEFPMHVCDALVPLSGMSGIDISGNRLACLGYPMSTSP